MMRPDERIIFYNREVEGDGFFLPGPVIDHGGDKSGGSSTRS